MQSRIIRPEESAQSGCYQIDQVFCSRIRNSISMGLPVLAHPNRGFDNIVVRREFGGLGGLAGKRPWSEELSIASREAGQTSC